MFMPVNTEVDSRSVSGAHHLLRALQQYYRDKSTAVIEGLGEEVIGATSLSLALSLIDDYLVNGLYVRKTRQKKLNCGKINWARTISRRTAFTSKGIPVYLDLETSHSRYVSDCETARIHASVIKEILSNYGELLLGELETSDIRLEQMAPASGETKAQLVYLDRELSLSYSDHDITLIRSLKHYLEQVKGRNNNLLIGTRSFHHVWEAMLDNILPGKISVNSQLPIPFYLQNEEYVPVAQKGQRTDTVIRNLDGSRVAVVDAKYYRAVDPQSAPGWSDLVKQMFYKSAVEAIVPEDTMVTLHFVFPGVEQTLRSAHVGMRTSGRTKTKPIVGSYPDIHCHYFEPVQLMKSYLSGIKQKALAEEIFTLE